MATDREAVVWTRLGGSPRRMGRFLVTDRECRFTYDGDYLATGLPGLGVLYPPALVRENTLVWQRTPSFDLFPQLQAHIPPESCAIWSVRALCRNRVSTPTGRSS